MASDGQRLYVGALDGAWVLDLRSQQWMRLKDELPSSVVLSVAVGDDRLFRLDGRNSSNREGLSGKRFGKMKT